MTNNMYIDFREVQNLVEKICIDIDEGDFVPDLVVGVGSGGATPAVMISHYFDIPFVSLAWGDSDSERESNCWLPEEAYNGKKILIIEDVCDTGDTLSEISDDWDASIAGLEDYTRWYDNVRFAALHVVRDCEFFVDFVGEEIDANDYIVYPWENWW